MFGSGKESLERDAELMLQIEKLWEYHHNLANLIKNVTEIMKEMADGMHSNKEDFAALAAQTLMIAEQQNKLIAHVMRGEGMINQDMESKSFH